MVGWYPGTPHQDILNTIRVVSFILSAITVSCAAVLFYAHKVCLIYLGIILRACALCFKLRLYQVFVFKILPKGILHA